MKARLSPARDDIESMTVVAGTSKRAFGLLSLAMRRWWAAWLTAITLLAEGGSRDSAAPRIAWTSAVALVFFIDLVFRFVLPPRFTAGVMDEMAHVATALLLLGGLRRRFARSFVVGVLLGSVLIDADHVPMEVGWRVLTEGTNRPYSHSALSIAVVLLSTAMLSGSRRSATLGVAIGIAAHLIRDMATGGVPFFWPITPHGFMLPYPVYGTMLIASLVRVLGSRRADLSRCRPKPAREDAGSRAGSVDGVRPEIVSPPTDSDRVHDANQADPSAGRHNQHR